MRTGSPRPGRRGTAAPARFAAAVALAIGAIGAASAAPVTFDTALPVAEGEWLWREQFIALRADDAGPGDREMNVFGGLTAFGYGLSSDWTLFAAVPYLDRELELTLPDGRRIERDSAGIGDARLFARYTLFRDDAPGRTFRVAPFAGLQLPSGENRRRDRFGRLPGPLQPGSGAVSPFAGLVATWQQLDFEVDVSAGYQANTEADGFEFGDEARLDASFQYRLWPRRLGRGLPGFLYGVVESNLIHQDRNRIAGVADEDSGGTSWLIAPGLQYATRRWVLEAVVQVPLVQNLHGAALKQDYTVRAGFRFAF